MEKYIPAFLTAFSITVVLITVALLFSKKIKSKEKKGRKSSRHIHNHWLTRVGGVAIILGFLTAILFDRFLVITPEIYAVMLASIIILIMGIWDDFLEVNWKIQFFFQIIISGLIFVMGIRIYFITNPFSGGLINLDTEFGILFSIGIVILWIVSLMNVMNWLDGIDGLSGGVAFLTGLTIFFLSLKPEVNQPPVAILAAIFLGAVLAFLIFNFYPSRILAGTSGAMFMGFFIAVLSIFAGTKIATALLVLLVPFIDFVWVIGERFREKRSIFKPDQSHLHHKLLKLGWSQKKINALFLGVTAVMAFVALNTRAIGKGVTILIAGIIVFGALFFLKKKTDKLKETKMKKA